jgi:hypothetical protein
MPAEDGLSMNYVNFYDNNPCCDWAQPVILYGMSRTIRNAIFVRMGVAVRCYGTDDSTSFVVSTGVYGGLGTATSQKIR